MGLYSAEQIDATVQSLAATEMVVLLTSLPSNTSLPTATDTATPLPSPTLSPTSSASETPSASPTSIAPAATFLPTVTTLGFTDPTQFAEDKSNKSDFNAPLVLDNQSGQEIQLFILSPVYGEYVFTKNMTLILPENTYTYRAWIGNKGPFSGTFSITNGDKHILIFRESNINFAKP
jgi:hypothetical protein